MATNGNRQLSELERQILLGVRDGEQSWQIGTRVGMSESWVNQRKQELRRRFGLPTMAAVVIAADHDGLLAEPPPFWLRRNEPAENPAEADTP